MSNSPTIGGTITGGIQDISALLPLLGTEQCEKHIGSALDRGFLYSSVAPMTIFGSLGIVRASFNILVASLSIRRYQFLGARVLSDSGFSPSGTVAPMIALDPGHPKRFVAETRLEAMLADEHIDNVADLTVSLGKDVVRWNFKLVFSTLFISLAGLLPYIKIIVDLRDANPKLFFPLGFGFPILRVFGSAICVIVAQFLIQIRIIILLKTRLLFMGINRLAKEAKVEDLASVITTDLHRERAEEGWDSELAAEKSVWALQKWLAAGSDTNKDKNYRKMETLFESKYAQHLGPSNTHIRPWITLLFCLILAAGCISIVVGYVGCFFLIQHSASSTGTLVWLGLEAVLSVLRILVWATNPSWDDPKGIVLELKLSPDRPMITCNKFAENILRQGSNVPLTRSGVFLEELIAWAGPLPSFNVPDVELYYILAVSGCDEREPVASKTYNPTLPHSLLIVISAHKEQTSRIFFKKDHRSPFSIYVCSLHPVAGTRGINVRVEGKTGPESHFLTWDPAFMTMLLAHYDKISLMLQDQRRERKAFFGRTWAMHQSPTIDNNRRPGASPSRRSEEAQLDSLKEEHKQYEVLYQLFVAGFDNHVKFYSTVLHDDSLPTANRPVEKDTAVDPLWKYEATEKEYLIMECRRYFELSLIFWAANMDRYFKRRRTRDTSFSLSNVRKIFVSIAQSGDRLDANELRQETMLNSMRTRVTTHWTQLDPEGFLGPEYDHTGSTLPSVMNAWKALLTFLSEVSKSLESDFPQWPSTAFFTLSPQQSASLNAASSSKQSDILIRIQRSNLAERMRSRFLISDINGNFAIDRDKVAQTMIDCQSRADQLFEFLALIASDLEHFTDPLTLLEKADTREATLRQVFREWRGRVKENEEALATTGAGSR
ncbi:hypothetical protein D9619_000363 [Psilocybe cf. subviscida]|uniref:Uncharacterized protein n=1 Tax=Psilocybe cf. subviscida TaxID=2480587 RepID=A0A8H5F2L7_9AGAR|nr:hypothetical protein D9619_000363 [Psilocybe cf. subviscida]